MVGFVTGPVLLILHYCLHYTYKTPVPPDDQGNGKLNSIPRVSRLLISYSGGPGLKWCSGGHTGLNLMTNSEPAPRQRTSPNLNYSDIQPDVSSGFRMLFCQNKAPEGIKKLFTFS